MTTAERLYAEAMELDPGEREWLATELLHSLSDDVPELSPAWHAEIARRIAEIESGRAVFHDWDDVRHELFAPFADAGE